MKTRARFYLLTLSLCYVAWAAPAGAQVKLLRDSAEIISKDPITSATAYLMTSQGKGGTSINPATAREVEIETLASNRYRVRARLGDEERKSGGTLVFFARTDKGQTLSSHVSNISGLQFAEISSTLLCNGEVPIANRTELKRLPVPELVEKLKDRKLERGRAFSELAALLTPERLTRLHQIENELGVPTDKGADDTDKSALLRRLSIVDALLTTNAQP